MRLTQLVHQTLQTEIQTGDIVIDATAGNGFDTVFLAKCVGASGHVYAFDIQQQAIVSSQKRLQNADLLARTTLVHASHADMKYHIATLHQGHIRCIVFNLGYLPRSDHQYTTAADSTCQALDAAWSMLVVGGVISMLAYTGHPGGREECDAVKAWCDVQAAHNCTVQYHIPTLTDTKPSKSPPEWIFIKKIS